MSRSLVFASILFLLMSAESAPGRASSPTDAPSSSDEGSSEFRARHADLVKHSREMALRRGGSLLRETPEPTLDFDLRQYRERFGDRTADVGRAWKPRAGAEEAVTTGPENAKGSIGQGLSVDFAVESLDLRAASGISGFLGTPPDTMGAVGPSEFFTVQNVAYRVHDKTTGAALPSLDIGASDFWLPAVDPTDRGGGDPRVRYDRIRDRWVLIAFDLGPLDAQDEPTLADNRILIALSDGPTIDGSTVWTQYFFVPKDTSGGADQEGCLADYPMLGTDRNAIYIGANMIEISPPSGACGGSSLDFDTAVFVIPWDLLPTNGGDVASITTALDGLVASTLAWNPMPADNPDPTADTGFVIAADLSSDTRLKLGRISNPGAAPGNGPTSPSLSWSDITVSNKNNGFDLGVPYTGVPEPEGISPSWGLDRVSFRPIGGASIRDGRLWTSMTSTVQGPNGDLRLEPSLGDRHSVVIFEIDVATNSLVQDGNVFDPDAPAGQDPIHVWVGSVAVNGQGHAVVAATGTNTTDLAPSAVWAGRLATDPFGIFSPPAVYLEGTDTGNARQSFELQERETRWGDYAQVTVDPCDDMTFYALAEYQDALSVATGGNWATGLARILAPPPVFLSVDSHTIPAGRSSVSVIVEGTGFHRPPSEGMPACRTDIEIASDISNLEVNGVTYDGPNELTIDFDTTAADGSGTVTLANPDGQTTTFALTVTHQIFADGFETGNTSAWSENQARLPR